MKKKPSSQSKRFIEKARELGADESGEEFERAFRAIVPPKKPPPRAGPPQGEGRPPDKKT